MLNNMIASFVASNQIGEEMKKRNEQLGLKTPKKKDKPKPESGYDDDFDADDDLSTL
ncbi:MAG: SPFH domain-containing protein, partial [Bacteroidota bacterium]|nr:SPFH domain-containing protein [Bacteroidota bacterium]